MFLSRRMSLAVLAACVSLLMLAVTAHAAGPATVTVRVEGVTETKLPPTVVTTTTAPVVNDGNPHACAGTSALGALQLATGGNWSGPWYAPSMEYEIYSIEGESHAFSSGFFWDFWINHAESLEGACKAEPQSGEELLFFPCSETAPECPSPLGIEAPASAGVGESVVATVKKYGGGNGSTVAGATITGAAEEVKTDSSGNATLNFTHSGEATVRVSAPELVRTETTICVHNGNDGNCGTTAPLGAPPATAPGTNTGVAGFQSSKAGPVALVAHLAGLLDGHVYGPGQAPRILSGSVLAPDAISTISIELHRRYKGLCWEYSGVKERFVRARCGHGKFFKVSNNGLFSYLLPSALGPGRYVLDVEASDADGDKTKLARGSSRIVFYVR